ncbi:MAG: DUF1565 domain-containing protein [Chloroflexi bacterium]|nr:MAG: DUF1565 domain-containing protein [Chloroflexota bacterium]MBL1195109.1 DUF1565 domain-containing protein [Chloroflexota bacterium]NOH12394.1 DUF1565 domain-containing protein [Chloroflexota bacterium]
MFFREYYVTIKTFFKRLDFALITIVGMLLLTACGPRSGPFGEYYVDVLGSDARGDGSMTNPWRTIQHALDHADYSGPTPRINVAKGIYEEELIITRSVVLAGAGMGDGTVSTLPDTPLVPIQDVSVIARRRASDAQGHLIRGRIRVDISGVIFMWGKVHALEAGLYLDGVRFEDVTGLYGLWLENNLAFNISNSHFTTPFNTRADYAIDMINAMGIIEDSTFGDQFDHVINIGRLSNVALERVDINGSDIFYADGIRVQSPADVIIRHSTIRRDHASVESDTAGVGYTTPYAGVEVDGWVRGGSITTIEISNTTISGYDVGIGIGMEGYRLLAFSNDISALTYPVFLRYYGYTEVPYPTIDMGGGLLGSPGLNTFRDVGPFAVNHLGPYEVYACFNEWEVPPTSIDPDRIWDQLDDGSLGRVHWDCAGASEPLFIEPPPGGLDLDPDAPTTLIVNRDTPCYTGPGSQWTFVDNLPKDTKAEVVGYAFIGDWLVVKHPMINHVDCWLDEGDVTPNQPTSEMRLIESPPKPTATVSPTPEDKRQSPDATPIPCYYDQNNALICP